MFDFDAGKFIIIGIVALIVIGPKELPRVMRQVGQMAAKMRRMAAEFHGQFMDAMREAEIDDIKSGMKQLADSAKADAGADPLAQIKAELTQAIAAAKKPAALPAAGMQAIATQHKPAPSEESLALCDVPEMEEKRESSRSATDNALAAPEANSARSGVSDAEMRALADALAAEIVEAAPRTPGADGPKTQDKG
jgi:sec-independent protein translocase protein TatB